MVYARSWFTQNVTPRVIKRTSFMLDDDDDDLGLRKKLINGGHDDDDDGDGNGCWEMVIMSDRLAFLEEEHDMKRLLFRIDFWLYYFAYFCGGTIGLVYSNNLGQIAQSLGLASTTSTLITLYSSFSFFGRLLSAVPDFLKA